MANLAQSETLCEGNKAWDYGMLFNNGPPGHLPKLEATTGGSHSKAVISFYFGPRAYITKCDVW